MTNGIIYLIKNSVSQKCYVGLTTKPIHIRWKGHLAQASRGDTKPLYAAIRKYGKESFEISVLEECLVEDLGVAEIKWIKFLDTVKNGYNIAEGGNGCIGFPSEETRKNISQSLQGHEISEETKEKISRSLKGRKLPEETKRKISEGLNRPECVEKRSAASRGKIHDKKTKSKISEKSKSMWQNDDFREKMSLKKRGSKNSRAQLTEDDVIRIRAEWASCGDPKRKVDRETCELYAIQTGSTPDAIFRMLRGHSWKHLI